MDYNYDARTSTNFGIGFRTSMIDNSSTTYPTRWEYDERGRLKKESKRIDTSTGSTFTFYTSFTYNSADLPITMTYPDTETVTYDYDDRMLLETVSGNANYVTSSSYDSAGRMTSRSVGNNVTQKYFYKAWNTQGGRLDKIVAGSGTWNGTTQLFTNTLQKLSYAYDNVGNVTQIAQIVNFSNNQTETQAYDYDALNRLTNWDLAVNGTPTQSELYEYNSVGNLWRKNGVELDYPAANGNTPTHPHAATSAGVNTFTYDANGNQETRTVGGNTYQLDYDAENRLVSVTGTNLSAQFTYNGDGQRVKSVVNNETIYFVGGYYEKKGAEIIKYYFAGASRVAMRKTIVPQTDTLTYLLGDHLGSTSFAMDASTGNIIETRYKPWGEVRYTSQDLTLPTRYTFTGQYSHMDDSATDLGAAGFGLMFYNARWVDPITGRFVQADNIVAYPANPQSWDRYAYTLNNPVRYIDPSGYCTGDPNDPDNPDADCWEMIRTIEGTYKNIHIFDQLAWTYNELVAFFKALLEHPFINDILSARSINVYRQDYRFFDGDRVAGFTIALGNGEYNLYIYDYAYNADPEANKVSVDDSLRNVEGTFLHELTHVALGQNPSILKSYREKFNKFPYDFIKSFGLAAPYSSNCEWDKDCMDSEIIAMAVTASQLVPFDGGWGDWVLVWVGTVSSESPIIGVCYGYQ